MEPQLLAKLLRVSGVETYEGPGALLEPRACSALAGTLLRVLRAAPASSGPRRALLARLRLACAPPLRHRPAGLLRLVLRRLEECAPHARLDLPSFLAPFHSDLTLEERCNRDEINLARALLNVHPEHPYLETITRKYLLYNGDKVVQKFLIHVWSNDVFRSEDLNNQLALKAIPEIEAILLDASYDIIMSKDLCVSKPLKNLINKASRSQNCFKICCEILNHMFIASGFNLIFQNFIEVFVKDVRVAACKNRFISLYDDELQSAVMMLNCDVSVADEQCDIFVACTLEILSRLRKEREEHFILLMSHYPLWFDCYLGKYQS